MVTDTRNMNMLLTDLTGMPMLAAKGPSNVVAVSCGRNAVRNATLTASTASKT